MPQNSHCPPCVHKSTRALVVFQPKLHIFLCCNVSFFFSLRWFLLCCMYYSVDRVIYFAQQMIFLRFQCSAVPLLLSGMKLAYISQKYASEWVHLLKYHKEEKGTFSELQLFLQRMMIKIIKWLNKTKGRNQCKWVENWKHGTYMAIFEGVILLVKTFS